MTFLRAVGEEFEKNVVPNARGEFKPAANAVFGGGIIGTKFAVFNSRQQALRPAEAEWAWNQQ